MRGFKVWLVATVLLITAGIAVPYGLMGGGAPSYDIVIFWCLFGIAVIALIAVGVSRWRI